MRFYLRRVRINQGGYDASGRYWGIGQPLYWYECDLPETLEHSIPWTYNHGPTKGKGFMCGVCGMSVRISYNDISDHIRADSREHAKELIRAKYPDAKFNR